MFESTPLNYILTCIIVNTDIATGIDAGIKSPIQVLCVRAIWTLPVLFNKISFFALGGFWWIYCALVQYGDTSIHKQANGRFHRYLTCRRLVYCYLLWLLCILWFISIKFWCIWSSPNYQRFGVFMDAYLSNFMFTVSSTMHTTLLLSIFLCSMWL